MKMIKTTLRFQSDQVPLWGTILSDADQAVMFEAALL